MADTIFFTEVDATVKQALDLRKSYYKGSTKNTDAYSWLYKKIAFAQATATSKVNPSKTATLAPRYGGGIGPSGLYREQKQTPKFIPKPHLNSVKISPIGDWGSVIKCDFTFTVYSLSQLDEMQPFFDLGSKAVVTYGWKGAGKAGGRTGKLDCVIYNFSQALNANGGFDCTIQTMAEGLVAIVGADTKGKSNLGNTTNESIADSVSSNTSLNLLTSLEIFKKVESTISVDTINTTIGLGVAKLPKNLIKANAPSESENAELDETKLYISLQQLIRQINVVLYGTDSSKWSFICNEEVTKGYVKQLDRDYFMSSDPTKIIFPGFVTYGGIKVGFDSNFSQEFYEGDLSKTMISIDYLIDVYKSINTQASQDRSKNTSITNFINKVLTDIYDCSGTRFKLSTFQNPSNKSQIYITDQGYIGEDVRNIAYEITTITQGGICRNMTLATNLSPEMISAAYATSLNSLGSQPTFTPGEESNTTTTTTEAVVSITDLQINVETAAQNLASSETTETDTITLITNLQTALKELYTFEVKSKDSPKAKSGIIFPLSLQITLDGIDGIIFGNAITTNYLPTVYRKENIAFTITTVDHTIENGDWTTTINTVMRII
jgi:hypothetical protein